MASRAWPAGVILLPPPTHIYGLHVVDDFVKRAYSYWLLMISTDGGSSKYQSLWSRSGESRGATKGCHRGQPPKFSRRGLGPPKFHGDPQKGEDALPYHVLVRIARELAE